MTPIKKISNSGFTLVELMIVIAIIGILASIAVPAYQDFIARAQVSEAIVLMDGLKSNITASYAQVGVCPDNIANTDPTIPAPSAISGKYTAKIEVTGPAAAVGGLCTMTAFIKSSGVSEAIKNGKIKITMVTQNVSSISWVCLSNIPQRYVPLVCSYDNSF